MEEDSLSCRLEEAHLAEAQFPTHPRALHPSAVIEPRLLPPYPASPQPSQMVGNCVGKSGLCTSTAATGRAVSLLGLSFQSLTGAPKGRFMWNMTLCSSLPFPTSLCGNSGLPMSSEAVMRNICLETLSRAEEKERKQDPSTRHGRYGGSLCL